MKKETLNRLFICVDVSTECGFWISARLIEVETPIEVHK